MLNKKYASKIYPLLLFSFIFFSNTVSGQDPAWLDKEVSLNLVNQPLKVLKPLLQPQCLCEVYVLADTTNKYNISEQGKSLRYILAKHFPKKEFNWYIRGNSLNIAERNKSKKQRKHEPNTKGGVLTESGVIDGIVLDDAGEPLPAVSIWVKGTSQRTATDHKGRFKLNVGDSVLTLVATFIGYKTTEWCGRPVSNLRILLKAEGNALQVVTVPGYLPTSHRSTTGSVAAVSGAEMRRYPPTNFLGQLAGRVNGFDVTQSNGVPGSSFQLKIRGRNSLINSPDPLIIVDDVPLAANNQNLNRLQSMLAQNTGGGVSPLIFLNPEDIDSIFIFKDAAATSIYGSRAANGVMLIKTRKGGKTGFQLCLDMTFGICEPTFKYHMQSTRKFIASRREGFLNDGLTPSSVPGDPGFAPDLKDTISYTDYRKVLLGNLAIVADAHLSASIGSANTKAFFSWGYRKETTPFDARMGNSLLSGLTSLQVKSKNDRMKFSGSLYLSSDTNKCYNGSLWHLFLRPNISSLYDSNQKLYWGEEGEMFENPEAGRRKSYRIISNSVLVSVTPQFKIDTNFSVRANLGYNGVYAGENLILPISAQNPALFDTAWGTSTFATNRFNSYIIEPIIDFSANDLKLLLGGSYQYSANNFFSEVGKGYSNDSYLYERDSAANFSDTLEGRSQYKYAALFGQANYSLKDRYFFNLTYRMDGSSRFAPEKRIGHFGSIGASWIISDEPFWSPLLHVLSYAKFRASYGVTGNDQIGDYKFLDTWAPSSGQPYQGMTGFTPESLYNPEYNWERSRKSDLAVELQSPKGRWSLNINYYLNRSDKQLVYATLPAQAGADGILKNFNAVIENTGWELAVSGDIYNQPGLRISTNILASLPKNSLKSFDDLAKTEYRSVFIVGKSTSALNLYEFEGVDQATGVYRVKDQDGNDTTDTRDLTYMGNLDPKVFGSASFYFRYKNIECELFWEFKVQKAPSYVYNTIVGDLLTGLPVNRLDLENNRWRKPGDIALWAKSSTTRTGDAHKDRMDIAASSLAYADGSYIKLGNVYLSYTCRGRRLSKAGIESIKLSIKGRNLFTATGYKGSSPETANLFALSPLRTITFSVQATFKDLFKQNK